MKEKDPLNDLTGKPAEVVDVFNDPELLKRVSDAEGRKPGEVLDDAERIRRQYKLGTK